MELGTLVFFALIDVFLILSYLLYARFWRDFNLPPGPTSLPVLGNLLSLGTLPHRSMINLSRKYGGIFRLWFGDRLAIVITDPYLMREAFVTKGSIYSDRTPLPSLHTMTDGGVDMVMSGGETWAKWRKISHSKLFVMSRVMKWEDKIVDELSEGTRYIDSIVAKAGSSTTDGTPRKVGQDLSQVLRRMSLNVICNMTFGHRFAYEGDKESTKGIVELPSEFSQTLMKLMEDNFKAASSANLTDYVWWLRYIPCSIGSHFIDHLKDVGRRRREVGLELIKLHRKGYDRENPRDFVDILLAAAEDDPTLSDVAIAHTITDFILAGSDTSAVTIAWLLVAMVLNPDIQSKVHAELDSVIGKDRLPRITDADNLPYLNAAIQETMRWRPVGPLSLPHMNTQEDVLGGYRIPKNSFIIMNIGGATHNEKLWPNPDEFDPSRFLTSDNEKESVERKFGMIPFGVGKRICAGMNLAKNEVFLMAATLLQRYEFSGEASTRENFGLVVDTDPFFPIIKRRV